MRGVFFILGLIFLTGSVFALSFSVEVPKEYAKVAPGEKVYFEIRVLYPENTERKDLILEYTILDKEGDVIARSDTLRAIETQLSLLDSVIVPDYVDVGGYSVNVRIRDSEGLNEQASASFNVLRKGMNWAVVFLWIVFLLIVIYFGFKLKGFWNRFWIRVRVKEIVRERFGRGD